MLYLLFTVQSVSELPSNGNSRKHYEKLMCGLNLLVTCCFKFLNLFRKLKLQTESLSQFQAIFIFKIWTQKPGNRQHTYSKSEILINSTWTSSLRNFAHLMLDICGITALYLSHLCYLRVTSFSWYHAGVCAHVQYLKEVNYNSEDISSQQRSLKHSFIRPVKTKNLLCKLWK